MPVFCSPCGKVMNGKYCVHCSAVIEGAETVGRAKDEKPLSFVAFHKQKSNNRMMQYQKWKKNDRREKDVFLIPASLLLAVKGALIQQRGSRLPKTVNVSWDHIDLKRQFLTNLSHTMQLWKSLSWYTSQGKLHGSFQVQIYLLK